MSLMVVNPPSCQHPSPISDTDRFVLPNFLCFNTITDFSNLPSNCFQDKIIVLISGFHCL